MPKELSAFVILAPIHINNVGRKDTHMNSPFIQNDNKEYLAVEVFPEKDSKMLLMELNNKFSTTTVSSKSLDGQSILQIIIALGSSGSVAALSKVLINWINARSQRSAKIGQHLLKGYSSKEVCQIIEKYLKSE